MLVAQARAEGIPGMMADSNIAGYSIDRVAAGR
jgi:hypothetical protein